MTSKIIVRFWFDGIHMDRNQRSSRDNPYGPTYVTTVESTQASIYEIEGRIIDTPLSYQRTMTEWAEYIESNPDLFEIQSSR